MSHSIHRTSSLPITVASLLLFLASQEAQAARPPVPFTVFGYLIGNPGQTELYEYIRDAGFDVLVATDARTFSGATQVGSRLNALAPRADGSRLRGIVTVEDLSQGACASVFENPTPVQCQSGIVGTVGSVSNEYPATTLGWSVSDEPTTRANFDTLLVETDIIDDVFSTYTIPYVNLLPIAGMYQMADGGVCQQTPEDFNRDCYECYVEHYLGHFDNPALPAPILSNDHYPFVGQTLPGCPQGTEHPWPHYNIFLNLTVMSKKAKEHSTPARRLPFWQIIQISKWEGDGDDFTCTFEPSEERVRFHAMASLAYGATGIGYWSLVKYQGIAEDNRYGPGIFEQLCCAPEPCTCDFTIRQPRYNFIQSLNGELHQLGDVLINLDQVDVFHEPEAVPGELGAQVGIESQLVGAPEHVSNIVAIISSTGDVGLVSHFRDPASGDDYLMVQNKSLTNSRDVTVTLNGSWSRAVRKNKQSGGYSAVYLQGGHTFTLSLLPGDAELLKLGASGGGCGDPPCEIEPAASLVSWSATPNPSRGRVTVRYSLPERTKVSLEILDIAGRRVASLVDAEQEAGAHSFHWDPTLSAGTCFLRLRTGTQVVGKKLLIVN